MLFVPSWAGLLNYVSYTLFKKRRGGFPAASTPDHVPWYFTLIPDEIAFGSDRDMALLYHIKRFGGGRVYFEPDISLNGSVSSTDPDYFRLGFNLGFPTSNKVFSGFGIGYNYLHAFKESEFEAYEREISIGLFADKLKITGAKRDIERTIFPEGKDWYFAISVSDLKGLIYWLGLQAK